MNLEPDKGHEKKRVLFVPDSLWGNASGHRSSKHLVRAFTEIGVSVGVYASKADYTVHQELECDGLVAFFEQTEYSYTHNIFRSIIKKEFLSVIEFFKPDYVFYMGTIKNKVTIDICIKYGIKYSYLPLTTEYYCVKNFAGLKDGPCFKCIKAPVISPIKNKCLGPRSNFLSYMKEIIFSIKSKPRILKANKIIGYSDNQLRYLEDFGVKTTKMLKMPIFFDPATINGIVSTKGDYFVMAGQQILAKGWHILPKVIKKSTNIKYKLIMRNEAQADSFIQKNGLDEYVKRGLIEILYYLETHGEVLEVMAKSRGVIVPSYYATSGEFYLLEALGLGKPTIVFDAGIHTEVIKNEENGMISGVGDIDSFHENIQKVNNDVNLYEQVSKGAKHLFEELLSNSNFKDTINNYFNEKEE